ncbi:MAG: helix-turn-helix domain-containing protein [Clostridium sp.]
MEAYLELDLKPCQIASKLGVHKSTISRELRGKKKESRNSRKSYS